MSEFIKLGNKIVTKPTGLDYDLINGKVYNLKYNRYEGMSYFEEDGSLNLPSKVYLTEDDKTFIHRVNTYFEKTSKLSTGVMLSGIKGTGKTVMAKVIARNSGLPVISLIRLLSSLMRQTSIGIQKTCQDGQMVCRLMQRNLFCLRVIMKTE